jgi:trk system potassium uptake protein TrkA
VASRLGERLDFVIHSETHLAERILRVLRLPGVSDVIEFAGGEVRLFGMNIEADSWLVGKTLEALDSAGPPRDSLIAMIFRSQQVIIPHGNETLESGDHIYVVATASPEIPCGRRCFRWCRSPPPPDSPPRTSRPGRRSRRWCCWR